MRRTAVIYVSESSQFLKRPSCCVDKNRMSVTPSQFDLLGKSIDISSLRHKVISHNLANSNTPEFHASHVEFQDALIREMKNAKPDPASIKEKVAETEGLRERFDGNNVDMDQQISQMDKNAILYQTYTQIMATKISMMRTAINGS
ncbi:MAG: flagellar biosynthesis protein FlgB [Planctomycetota bacterium]